MRFLTFFNYSKHLKMHQKRSHPKKSNRERLAASLDHRSQKHRNDVAVLVCWIVLNNKICVDVIITFSTTLLMQSDVSVGLCKSLSMFPVFSVFSQAVMISSWRCSTLLRACARCTYQRTSLLSSQRSFCFLQVRPSFTT